MHLGTQKIMTIPHPSVLKLLTLSRTICTYPINLRLVHIDQISDVTDREALEKDLKTEKDSDRQLKVIKERTAEEIFHILKIDNPKCDHNKNHMIEGDELKCLNFAWKAYVPH